jgi:hypothetical protein
MKLVNRLISQISFTSKDFWNLKEKRLVKQTKFDFSTKQLTVSGKWKGIIHLCSDSFSTLIITAPLGNFFSSWLWLVSGS